MQTANLLNFLARFIHKPFQTIKVQIMHLIADYHEATINGFAR